MVNVSRENLLYRNIQPLTLFVSYVIVCSDVLPAASGESPSASAA